MRSLALGTLAGLGLALVSEAVRPRGGPARLLDWEEVSRVAHRHLRGERLSQAQRKMLEERYQRLAAEVTPTLLDTVGGLPPGAELPFFSALDRQGWLELNLEILRRALAPLAEARPLPGSWLADLGRAALDRYLGLLLAFLSGRVLGQFDPQLLGKEPVQHALYLVEPNIVAWQEKEDLPGGDLRRWLILHELTHAWQFSAHPWLREHLNTQITRMVELAAVAGRQRGLGQLWALTLGVPAQWEAVRRLQAVMTLIEGYSNLTMDLVGRRLLSSFDQLEAAHRRRLARRSPLEVLLWRLTGLELKLRQYEVGEAFARTIHESYGMATLNRAWEGVDSLPRPDELRQPELWYRRVVLGGAPCLSP